MIKKFAEELKEQRIKSDITLQQIHARTRIDLKFLEAIESGNFDVLPEVYLRAFLKDYARAIGYDETLAIKKYEAARTGKPIEEKVEEVQSQDTPEPKKYHSEEVYSPAETEEGTYSRLPRSNTFWGLVAILFLVLVVILYIMFFQGPSEIVTERPYEELLSEKSQDNSQAPQTDKEEPVVQDSLVQDSSAAIIPVKRDSLRLTIKARQTTWLLVKLDNQNSTLDFILKPNTQKMLKAARNFNLTIGNSAGVSLALNNNPLNFSGNPKQVKTVNIDSTGIKYK